MKVKFYAPSYKRPEKSITQKNYPFIKLVVRESDAEEYLKNGNDIVICPDSAQGNVSRVKNWMLDNLYDEDVDCIIFMDDDCSGIFRWEGHKKVKLNADELLELGDSLTEVCNDWGFKLWGLAPIPDKSVAREGTPFNTLSFVGSPFHAHLKGSGIRYDEELSLKEDYDITLQHIQKWSGVLRVNWLCYSVKQGVSGSGQTGGCATYRNNDNEIRQFKLLQKKWGSHVVKRDKSSRREFDTNPIISVPLKGV